MELTWAMFWLVAFLVVALVAGCAAGATRWHERADRDRDAIEKMQDQLLLFVTDEVASRRMDRDDRGKRASIPTNASGEDRVYDEPRQYDMTAGVADTDESPG